MEKKAGFWGWLFGTPAPAPKALEAPVVAENEPYTSAALTQHFAKMSRQMKEVPQNDTVLGPDALKKWLANYRRITSALESLDANRLLPKDVKQLRSAIYEELPRVVNNACDIAYESSWWHVSYKIIPNLTAVLQQINEVLLRQADPTYARLTPPFPMVANPAVPATIGVAGEFPHLTPLTPMVDQGVQRLAKLWQTAVTRDLSVEDRFLLEQIVVTYLPDTWRLLVTFQQQPPATQQELIRMVHEQVFILTEQVQDILNSNTVDPVRAMAAQTDFIRMQREHKRPATDRLNLEKEQN